jgi:hypothetical protein
MRFGLTAAGLGAVELWHPLPPLGISGLLIAPGFALMWASGVK